MKRRDLIRHLIDQGCVFVREGQSHTIYENPVTGQRVPIPRHRDILIPLAKAICRQLEIPTP